MRILRTVVIEFLTFRIDPDELTTWLPIEEATWSRFLERQDGFLSKQMWVEREHPNEVHAVITWRDEASWLSIPEAEIDAVDAAMGPWVRAATCRVFDVVRNT